MRYPTLLTILLTLSPSSAMPPKQKTETAQWTDKIPAYLVAAFGGIIVGGFFLTWPSDKELHKRMHPGEQEHEETDLLNKELE